jgi:hypothetical protein
MGARPLRRHEHGAIGRCGQVGIMISRSRVCTTLVHHLPCIFDGIRRRPCNAHLLTPHAMWAQHCRAVDDGGPTRTLEPIRSSLALINGSIQ